MKRTMTGKGTLEVICGSMFSGKSEELIRRLKRAELARFNVMTFKHSLDTRATIEYVTSHNGSKVRAIPIDAPDLILSMIGDTIDVIGIDEVQFFPNNIINVICSLVDVGKRVLVAGLDLDFRGIPFGCIPTLMAIADSVTKLKAICIHCGNEAQFTQRLVNGSPAHFDDPLILIGAQENYQARCRSCHTIDRRPFF
jgi:thymidine kinase